MLDDVRVLEISAPETMLAGRILADLGADVIVVEPPAGSPGRRPAPFLDDTPGIERSLVWQALNYNKRGVTLELASPDGMALMRDLAAKFDVVLEAVGGGKSRRWTQSNFRRARSDARLLRSSAPARRANTRRPTLP